MYILINDIRLGILVLIPTSHACTSSYTSLANAHTDDIPTLVVVHLSVFFGTRPVYFIADVDLVREITVKHFDKFTDRLVSATCVYYSLLCLTSVLCLRPLQLSALHACI